MIYNVGKDNVVVHSIHEKFALNSSNTMKLKSQHMLIKKLTGVLTDLRLWKTVFKFLWTANYREKGVFNCVGCKAVFYRSKIVSFIARHASTWAADAGPFLWIWGRSGLHEELQDINEYLKRVYQGDTTSILCIKHQEKSVSTMKRMLHSHQEEYILYLLCSSCNYRKYVLRVNKFYTKVMNTTYVSPM